MGRTLTEAKFADVRGQADDSAFLPGLSRLFQSVLPSDTGCVTPHTSLRRSCTRTLDDGQRTTRVDGSGRKG